MRMLELRRMTAIKGFLVMTVSLPLNTLKI
jgi:hypothetical protein